MGLSQGVYVTEELHIGVLMFIAHRAAENRILEALHRAGFTEITMAQARLGARIGPNGTRLNELAEQAQVAKQTATFLVDQLEKAGYAERVPDPTDGRARLVQITEFGKDLLPIARAEEARIDADWTAHIGVRRMKQLREALTMLREITDPY
ncbi:MarR family winged helix-turn-helix transcriptional regulator [Antrihabitans sp. NCIMB 15449]|uniref:MarR family winged helix-turn-helix transcriptional regulator n=2 Tax=Antrihabitans spumae TaxID=3373370 RepID=A0ABW7KVB8_9NOCA